MYISLTTTPKRIQNIELNILSLKKQTVPPTKILLWVPHLYKGKKEYSIPDFLLSDPMVEIIRCKDVGPATKFIHTIDYLGVNKDFIIVDDDTIYSQYLIEDLTALPNLYGAKCVKGTAFEDWNGKAVKSRDPDYPNRQRKSLRVIGENNKPDSLYNIKLRMVPIVCGCDGILVNTSFFNSKIYNIQKDFLNCDDIWLSGYLAINKIEKIVVPCREISRTKSEFQQLPFDLLYGGTITKCKKTNNIKYKRGEMPHVRYLSTYGCLDGGKYETINNYEKVIRYFNEQT